MMLDEALDALNIPKAKHEIAKTLAEVERKSKTIGFPVVLKLISPKAVHKTEAGGVVIARDPGEVREAANKLLKLGKVLVQEYVEGVEFFLGIKKDRSFGYVLLAGLGGIFVEVYKDVSFRVCPISEKDAKEMLSELKGKALLEGARGKKPVDKDALADVMVRLSRLPEKLQNLGELDVNPIMCSGREIKAVDARIVLEE